MRVTSSPLYECVVTLACVANLILIFVRDYTNNYSTGSAETQSHDWIVTQFAINFCFGAEMILIITVWGVKHSWKNFTNMKLEGLG